MLKSLISNMPGSKKASPSHSRMAGNIFMPDEGTVTGFLCEEGQKWPLMLRGA